MPAARVVRKPVAARANKAGAHSLPLESRLRVAAGSPASRRPARAVVAVAVKVGSKMAKQAKWAARLAIRLPKVFSAARVAAAVAAKAAARRVRRRVEKPAAQPGKLAVRGALLAPGRRPLAAVRAAARVRLPAAALKVASPGAVRPEVRTQANKGAKAAVSPEAKKAAARGP